MSFQHLKMLLENVAESFNNCKFFNIMLYTSSKKHVYIIFKKNVICIKKVAIIHNLLKYMKQKNTVNRFHQDLIISSRDHPCGWKSNSLSVIQQIQVFFPVGSVSCWGFFRSFSSTIRRMSGNLGRICPRISFGHHNHPNQSSFIYGRRWSLTSSAIHVRR